MNPMALFTMSNTRLEISVRTITKDNRSSVPIGFHHLTKSSNPDRGFTLIELLIMSFAEITGMNRRGYRSCELYGRITQAHRARECKPVLVDNHLDWIVTMQPPRTPPETRHDQGPTSQCLSLPGFRRNPLFL